MALATANQAHAAPERIRPLRVARWLLSQSVHGVSLRTKALLAIAGLAAYLVALGVIVSQERTKLRSVVEGLTAVRQLQESLASANMLAAHAVLAFNDVVASPEADLDVRGLLLDVEALQVPLQALLSTSPQIRRAQSDLTQHVALVRQTPTRAELAALRDGVYRLVRGLDEPNRAVRLREQALMTRFHASYDAITWLSVGLGVLGMALFGGLATLFFGRLALDIRRLERRAKEIVKGYRGKPLGVHRRDEVGSLMQAVNGMAVELDRREKDLAIERQKVFHQEKMAALGSLATGLLHEIGNPIAAIDGVARSIDDVQVSGTCAHQKRFCHPELILQQTARLSAIAHNIAAFATPQPSERQLVDLNGLIHSTCALMRFDRRLRSIRLEFDLDKRAPAIEAMPDRLTQVLMNLIANAADALEGVRDARISFTTRFTGSSLMLSVADNGPGVEPELVARVFEPFFTTKPAGKGTGLGLSISRSIIEEHGGSIELRSAPGAGTQLCVVLPVT